MRRSTAFAASLACAAAAFAAPAPAEELLDGIAAQVGSQIVLVSEVLDVVGSAEAELRAAGGSAEAIARLRVEGLEQLIQWRLLEQVVRQTELYASEEEIDGAIRAIAQDNGLGVEELRESVTAHGMSFEDYRGELKREIERSKVLGAMISSKVRIEEEELRQLYAERFTGQPEGGEQLHLRQILLPFGEGTGFARAEACERVARARERILGGEPFEQVASRNNAIAPSRGGDIGWVHTDSLAGWMHEVVSALTPGQLSDLVELPFACSVLQLVERRAHEPVSYEAARPALERELFSRREAEGYRKWMNRLRETTYIERKGRFAQAARLDLVPGRRVGSEPALGDSATP